MSISSRPSSFSVTHFGFRRKPFQGSGIDFLRAHPTYEQKYAQLLDEVRRNRRLILLIGDSDTGKTTLLNNLARDPTVGLDAVFCEWSNDFDKLLSSICRELGLSTPNSERASQLEALKKYIGTNREGIVIIIDDADGMDQSIVRQIFNLTHLGDENSGSISIILAGPSQLERCLTWTESVKSAAEAIARIHLLALTDAEAKKFIRKQIDMAGGRNRSLFAEAAIQRVVKYCQGNKRRINTLCSRALLLAEISRQTSVSENMIDQAAIELGLLDPVRSTNKSELAEAPYPADAGKQPPSRLASRRRLWLSLAAIIPLLAAGAYVFYNFPIANPPIPHPTASRGEPSASAEATTSVGNGTGDSALSTSEYLVKGDRMLRLGNIATARSFYHAAAADGAAEAMTAMGKSYDPRILRQIEISAAYADPVIAAEWYLKGGYAGDAQAAGHLDELMRWLRKEPAYRDALNRITQELLD